MADLTPAPHGVAINEARTGFMNRAWVQWFDDIRTRMSDGHKSLLDVTVSSDTTLDIKTNITSDYEHYKLVLQDILVTQPSDLMNIRVSLDTGSTFESATDDYTRLLETNTGSIAVTNDDLDSELTLNASGLGNTSSSMINGVIEFFTPSNTINGKFFRWNLSYKNDSGTLVLTKGTGLYNGTGAFDALRLYLNAGTFISGKYKLYGVR